MQGTFNGVPLKKITSVKTTNDASGVSRNAFRVLDGPLHELEQVLRFEGAGSPDPLFPANRGADRALRRRCAYRIRDHDRVEDSPRPEAIRLANHTVPE